MNLKQQNLIKLLKECVVDLLQNDIDVRTILIETLQKPIPPKPHIDFSDPSNPELWDKLVLVAQNKLDKISFNGKKIVVPNHDIGYKSPEMIKEWASKAYTKLGAEWNKKNKNNASEGLLMNDSYSPSRNESGDNFNINDVFGSLVFKDGNSVVSMADMAKDSMRTVQDQSSHGHGLISESKFYDDLPNDQSYGESSDELKTIDIPKSEEVVAGGYNNWAKLAFFDQ